MATDYRRDGVVVLREVLTQVLNHLVQALGKIFVRTIGGSLHYGLELGVDMVNRGIAQNSAWLRHVERSKSVEGLRLGTMARPIVQRPVRQRGMQHALSWRHPKLRQNPDVGLRL